MEDLERDAGNVEPVAFAELPPRPARSRGGPDEVRPLAVRRHRDTLPDFPRMEVARDRQCAADVIAVGMREREPVEAAHAQGPERRRHDAAADVELAQSTRID